MVNIIVKFSKFLVNDILIFCYFDFSISGSEIKIYNFLTQGIFKSMIMVLLMGPSLTSLFQYWLIRFVCYFTTVSSRNIFKTRKSTVST